VGITLGSSALAALALCSLINSALETAVFANFAATAALLPVGCSDNDIGSPGVTGGAAFDGTTFTVAALRLSTNRPYTQKSVILPPAPRPENRDPPY
jgi:hypothetical protein